MVSVSANEETELRQSAEQIAAMQTKRFRCMLVTLFVGIFSLGSETNQRGTIIACVADDVLINRGFVSPMHDENNVMA